MLCSLNIVFSYIVITIIKTARPVCESVVFVSFNLLLLSESRHTLFSNFVDVTITVLMCFLLRHNSALQNYLRLVKYVYILILLWRLTGKFFNFPPKIPQEFADTNRFCSRRGGGSAGRTNTMGLVQLFIRLKADKSRLRYEPYQKIILI